MNKQLSPLEALKEIEQHNFGGIKDFSKHIAIIKTALKDYEELLKIDCKQNTINDFYPNTKAMIDDLLNLVCTKVADFLKEGKTYTRTGMLETLGFAIRYVKTFAYGGEFNETEKIGVNAKKLADYEKKSKALEIIKRFICFEVEYGTLKTPHYSISASGKVYINQEEYELLNEVVFK